jgi:hypothetical protein
MLMRGHAVRYKEILQISKKILGQEKLIFFVTCRRLEHLIQPGHGEDRELLVDVG